MYFVDRKLLEKRLQYLEGLSRAFSQQEHWKTTIDKLALERITHMTIEAIIDVGNQLIDGFIMRDPGSYDDVIDILVDERVIPKSDEASFKDIIALRKSLLQNYTDLNYDEIYKNFHKEIETIESFPGKVRTYIENELGPVSAFLPDRDK
ncbi:uncharacterized protein YutE (UPF0331/DUF86 family) [Evansella vedderi]|uniref:Uncharacterized protein YutE (UPF0331/DUF86 family) n=1 Tax=Evansella vedderi TaxID=38282 RepID=A0ABU0A3U0_9BACI|nr:DUF86 domain-containing protein [Evansella vedderi]MDQ0257636.1 uncharacterized protein YutE (UPF0331/DUF86 family) [Evansella vedderi]